jgi:hypothetical protein
VSSYNCDSARCAAREVSRPLGIGKRVDDALLVVDSDPWYDSPLGYPELAAEVFGGPGLRIVGPGEMQRMAVELIERRLRPRDLILMPLMSGAMFLPGVSELAQRYDVPVMLLPLSRHPFVTLSRDTPTELHETCALYAESSAELTRSFGSTVSAMSRSFDRIVYLDTNSATGRDMQLFTLRMRQWLGYEPEIQFLVAINETGEDPSVGPGWRGGPRARLVDDAYLRLVNSNTKYLSHLRFLARSTEEQVEVARTARGAFPDLTSYWDTIPDEMAHVHNYRGSDLLIHKERTHVRMARDDEGRQDLLTAAIRELDRRAKPLLSAERMATRQDLLRQWTETRDRLLLSLR